MPEACPASRRMTSQKAIADFQKSVSIDPKMDRAHFSIGTIQLESKNYNEALKSFTKDLELRPDNPETNFKIAETYP